MVKQPNEKGYLNFDVDEIDLGDTLDDLLKGGTTILAADQAADVAKTNAATQTTLAQTQLQLAALNSANQQATAASSGTSDIEIAGIAVGGLVLVGIIIAIAMHK